MAADLRKRPKKFIQPGACLECKAKGDLHIDTSLCRKCHRRGQVRLAKADFDARATGRPRRVPKAKGAAPAKTVAPSPPAAPEPPPPPPPPVDDEITGMATVARELRERERNALTIEEAVQVEEARRELARRHLIHFTTRRLPRYKAGWFHHMVAHELEQFSDQVANELSPRLMLFAPPRHGKSQLGSIDFPAFHLGRNPWHQYIGVSYSAPLAYKFSRAVQDIVDSDDFELLFPDCKLREDMSSVEEWGTTQEGVYTAAGVGGPISGKGAHILNIDDVIKNREDADSPAYRQMVQDWYTSTAYTRLMPGGGVLAINTRWHDADLMGWLMAMMQEAEKIAQTTGEWPEDFDKWRVVEYPAIAIEDEKYRKKGEALHPERYSLKALLRTRRTLGERDFQALYQQRPAPEDGEYFTKECIQYFEGNPDLSEMAIIMAGDLAISKKEFADYSVFVVPGITANDDIYVLDVRRGRWDSLEILNEMFALYRKYRPQLIGLEEGQIEKAIGPFLQKRIMEEKLFAMNIESLKAGKRDKELRARPIQGRMKQRKVFIAKGRDWTEPFVSELLRFPNGVKDDQVDALAWIGQMLASVNFTPRRFAPKKGWRDKLKRLGQPAARSGNAMAA